MREFHWWRTVLYLIPTVALYTVGLGTISLVSTLFDRSGNFAHRCARAWAWLILRTAGVRVRVQGLEHLRPGRSYVFAATHQSIYDIPIVFTSIPAQLRIVAKESLGRIPFMGWHLHRAGHLLVDRRNPGPDIVEKMKRLEVEAGYPSGTGGERTLVTFKGPSGANLKGTLQLSRLDEFAIGGTLIVSEGDRQVTLYFLAAR